MKIRKSIIYIIPILIFLFLDELFMPYPNSLEDVTYKDNVKLLGKLLPFCCLLYILFSLLKQRISNVFIYSLPVVYFIYLIFESLYLYGSFFQFPHVGLKIMDLVIVSTLCIFYLNHNFSQYNLVMNVIIVGLIMKIIIDPSMISTASFLEHERGIPSGSAFLLLLPCLYFFNSYIVDFKQISFIKFLFLLGFIIFIQHRTVWVATGIAFFINIFLLNKQNKIQIRKIIPGIIPIGIAVLMTVSVTITYLPNMVDKINENIENIFNPANEGTTSNWRIVQFESYIPFVLQHPIEGLRFQGFELPIQFYNPETSLTHWEDGTGHHFHSFYLDKLFYFGLIGLVLFLFYIFRPFYLVAKYNLKLNHEEICFLSFSFSGLIYGIGYDFPMHYFIFLGVTLAIVEREKVKATNQNLIDIELGK